MIIIKIKLENSILCIIYFPEVDDISKILKKIKGYDNLTELIFYNYWIKEFKRNKLKTINKTLRSYIYNKETYIKNYNHFN